MTPQEQGKFVKLDVILDRQWSRTMSIGSISGSRKFKESTPAAAAAAGAPKPLQTIDMSKLVIREVIGLGAIGKVHRGTYNNEEVAIKLLDCSKPGLAGDGISDWRRVCLMRELRIWRKLDHPNIVKLIGASPGVADKNAFSNVCCLVSEYMSTGSLREYLMSQHKRLSYKLVIQLGIDIARGLEYLHSRKIIHRDVKTKNILLDSALRAKIGDFDSARILMEADQAMSGEIGTFGYMAPEVMDGRAYDCKSDVFSFGICLLEIYSCDMAYGLVCLSLADITKGLVYRNLRPKIPRSCPGELAYVMKRCWKKNPDKRPRMSEVVRMLEAIAKGNSLSKVSPQCNPFPDTSSSISK
ncbi:serine/threonine-protein kinase STY8 [Selaginella moellendorffii]|nr:serine/threonine-protein kinase STY8 [Selaginella moellendorffii]|eukprot:XP_002963737.2 serine/threonine-protein kinase STY8 [Selaginella moellendorffii]